MMSMSKGILFSATAQVSIPERVNPIVEFSLMVHNKKGGGGG